MEFEIESVEKNSIAHKLHLTKGDRLLKINGCKLVDQIDYMYFMAEEKLTLLVKKSDGSLFEAKVNKASEDDLGCEFKGDMLGKMQRCKNKCVFCFVDQLPQNMRETLYVKDDDWRMSFLMGNYITLTNVNDAEFERILARRVSPLFISVHATDPGVRVRMMGNPNGANIMERLQQLAARRITFHSQIVIVKNMNDGAVLEQSVRDLVSLYPYSKTVALVPVGLTGHREGLAPVCGIDRQRAREIIHAVQGWQEEYLKRLGTRFVFAADELYIRAGLMIPGWEEYEDFEQKENGVGLIADFLCQAEEALGQENVRCLSKHISTVTGTDVYPYIRALADKIEEKLGVRMDVYAVENDFFGHSVTVTGLLTGGDIIKNLKGKDLGDVLLLPCNMLKETSDVFLDGVTLEELQTKLKVPCKKLAADGYDLIEKIKESI